MDFKSVCVCVLCVNFFCLAVLTRLTLEIRIGTVAATSTLVYVESSWSVVLLLAGGFVVFVGRRVAIGRMIGAVLVESSTHEVLRDVELDRYGPELAVRV